MPGFHLIAYELDTSSSIGLADADMTALIDQTLTTRNGHYFLTAPFQILGAAIYGNVVNRASLRSPTFNAYGRFNIWPLNDSTVSASPPRMDLWFDYKPRMPINEEIQVAVNSTGADTTTALIILGANDWTRQIPTGQGPVPVQEQRFTSTVTLNAQAYSTPAAVNFEVSLRAGMYAVVGCQCQGTGLIAFRLIFNRPQFYMNIPLRPGAQANQVLGDQPLGMGGLGPMMWGQWGRFATTELPQLEALGIGSSTITVEGRMYLVYLSDSVDVQY